MNNELNDIICKLCPSWSKAFLILGDDYSIEFGQLIDWLKESGQALPTYILDAKRKPSKKDTKTLALQLVNINAQDIEKGDRYLTIFRQVVISGNELEVWDLEVPYIPISAPREKGRFTPDRFKSHNFYDIWKNCLDKSIVTNKVLSVDSRIGQLLLSSVLYSGVLNSQLLSALLKITHKSPKVFNGRGCVDLSITWLGNEGAENRRLFLDSLTEVLIWRLDIDEVDIAGKTTNQITKIIFRYIKDFFHEMKLDIKHIPSSITGLLDTCSLRYELMLPPFISHYLQRKHLSHSIKQPAWDRIEGKYDSINSQLIADHIDLEHWQSKESRESGYDDESDSDTGGNISFNQIIKIPSYHRSSDMKGGLKKQAEEFIGNPDCLIILLLSWAAEELSKGRRGRPAPVPKTMKRYIQIIGSRLYELLGNVGLLNLDANSFEDAYMQVIEDIDSKGLRRDVAKLLNRFHRYVVKAHNVVEIDYRGVLGDANMPTPVDANILLVDEFNLMLKVIDESNLILKHPKLVPLTKILAILGYKCGLRRSEALKLRLCDVDGSHEPMLLVRPHKGRSLKSSSSKRALPLKALLEKVELDLLMSWLKERKAEESRAQYSNYLFSIPEMNYYCVSEDLVFPAIHTAMRASTGDESLRYHHFRHSFGSLTLLRLMVSDYGIPKGIFDNQPETLKWLEASDKFRTELYKQNTPTRKHLLFVSQLLGHSLPDISLEHYVHTLDIISAHLISKRFAVDTQILIVASGLTQSTAYRLASKNSNKLMDKIRRTNGFTMPVILDRSFSLTALDIEIEKSGSKVTNDAWKLLYLHSERGVGKEDLCERFNYSECQFNELIDNAKDIKAYNSNDRLKSSKFRMMNSEKDEETLLCPRRPRIHAEIEMADKLSDAINHLKDNNFEEFKSLMILYKSSAWSSRYLVVFKNIDQANKFIGLYSSLNLPKEWIDYSVLVGQTTTKKDINSSVNIWKESLIGIDKKRLIAKGCTDGASVGKHGHLGINLVCPQSGKAGVPSRYSFIMSLITNGL
jgi:integrase